MANEVTDWISNLIDQHDIQHGSDFSPVYTEPRIVQIVKFETYRDPDDSSDETQIVALASDRAFTIRIMFGLQKTDEIYKQGKTMTKDLRHLYKLHSYSLSLPSTPPDNPARPPIFQLNVYSWQNYYGSPSEPIFHPTQTLYIPLQAGGAAHELARDREEGRKELQNGVRDIFKDIREGKEEKTREERERDVGLVLAYWWSRSNQHNETHSEAQSRGEQEPPSSFELPTSTQPPPPSHPYRPNSDPQPSPPNPSDPFPALLHLAKAVPDDPVKEGENLKELALAIHKEQIKGFDVDWAWKPIGGTGAGDGPELRGMLDGIKTFGLDLGLEEMGDSDQEEEEIRGGPSRERDSESPLPRASEARRRKERASPVLPRDPPESTAILAPTSSIINPITEPEPEPDREDTLPVPLQNPRRSTRSRSKNPPNYTYTASELEVDLTPRTQQRSRSRSRSRSREETPPSWPSSPEVQKRASTRIKQVARKVAQPEPRARQESEDTDMDMQREEEDVKPNEALIQKAAGLAQRAKFSLVGNGYAPRRIVQSDDEEDEEDGLSEGEDAYEEGMSRIPTSVIGDEDADAIMEPVEEEEVEGIVAQPEPTRVPGVRKPETQPLKVDVEDEPMQVPSHTPIPRITTPVRSRAPNIQRIPLDSPSSDEGEQMPTVLGKRMPGSSPSIHRISIERENKRQKKIDEIEEMKRKMERLESELLEEDETEEMSVISEKADPEPTAEEEAKDEEPTEVREGPVLEAAIFDDAAIEEEKEQEREEEEKEVNESPVRDSVPIADVDEAGLAKPSDSDDDEMQEETEAVPSKASTHEEKKEESLKQSDDLVAETVIPTTHKGSISSTHEELIVEIARTVILDNNRDEPALMEQATPPVDSQTSVILAIDNSDVKHIQTVPVLKHIDFTAVPRSKRRRTLNPVVLPISPTREARTQKPMRIKIRTNLPSDQDGLLLSEVLAMQNRLDAILRP